MSLEAIDSLLAFLDRSCGDDECKRLICWPRADEFVNQALAYRKSDTTGFTSLGESLSGRKAYLLQPVTKIYVL